MKYAKTAALVDAVYWDGTVAGARTVASWDRSVTSRDKPMALVVEVSATGEPRKFLDMGGLLLEPGSYVFRAADGGLESRGQELFEREHVPATEWDALAARCDCGAACLNPHSADERGGEQ